MTPRHEQTIAFRPAEADVGGTLRQADVADRRALRIEDADTVKLGGAHAPAAPQIAVDIDAEAVRRLGLGTGDELLRIGELRSVDIEHVDRAGARIALDHI